MLPTRDGSVRLFRFSGIDVFLHWSWFAALVYFSQPDKSRTYSSPVWNVVEVLALFLIVLMHEFGHSLACRSTGGRADQIVLWPLGGVAYVAPPQRPGAQLWSIAAGPLVNVALVPVLYLAVRVAVGRGLDETQPDFHAWLESVRDINLALLIFNLLPVYPLDGGQILRSVLWYFMGPVTSVLIAAGIGLAGGLALVACGLFIGRYWLALVAGFMFLNCLRTFRHALALRARQREEARAAAAPPSFPA